MLTPPAAGIRSSRHHDEIFNRPYAFWGTQIPRLPSSMNVTIVLATAAWLAGRIPQRKYVQPPVI